METGAGKLEPSTQPLGELWMRFHPNPELVCWRGSDHPHQSGWPAGRWLASGWAHWWKRYLEALGEL